MPADVSDKRIFWHRELPPIDSELMGEHVLEATSDRVAGSLAVRDELWDHAYRTLMEHAQQRLEQEMDRLGGHYAHVFDESVDSRRDDAAGEAWLHGLFKYTLYGRRNPRHTGHRG